MLPDRHRLRDRRDFRLVYAQGRSYVHPMLVLYVRRTSRDETRIGFSVSKKLGGAVERNRTRRRLREGCRLHIARLRPGFDLALVARSRLKEASFDAVQAVLIEVFERARLWTLPQTQSESGLSPS